MEIKLTSIGMVSSSRAQAIDDNWDHESSIVELSADFNAEAFAGLSDYSHVEILFYMDRVDPTKIEIGSRHPRNRKDWPEVGIFAQRGKNRPNQIGSTICEILSIEGTTLKLKGLDAIDGTPVLDIKPWVKEFGPRGNVRQPSWISELMLKYWS